MKYKNEKSENENVVLELLIILTLQDVNSNRNKNRRRGILYYFFSLLPWTFWKTYFFFIVFADVVMDRAKAGSFQSCSAPDVI